MKSSFGILSYAIVIIGALLFLRSATALGTLFITAVVLGALVRSSSSKINRIHKAARRLVCERLSQPSQKLPAEVVKEWAIGSGQANSAKALLDALDATLEIHFGNIAPADRLGDVFRVKLAEIPEISTQDWDKAKWPESVEVFGTDILYVIEKQSTIAWWSSRYRALNPPSKNEDQWIDAIMNMSAKQFLEFFAIPDAM